MGSRLADTVRELAPRLAQRDTADSEHYLACNSEKGAGGSLAATKTIAERRDGRFALTGEKILASFSGHAGRLARTLAASFAGTALRPPLPLALDTLVQQFSEE